ncbi:neuroblast differentiation-associated protein AHNAK [Eleginops maclovinus]|uniref:neuroblast differentiation-associated protein AHNAK n=1 Tax=Eleginops maclovinus TaxID=56733 RepID=UPI00308089DC
MAVAQGLSLPLLLLLVSSGLLVSSHLPACPESCTCQRAPLLNCSSAGLSLMPQQIQDSVIELDLSHNLLDSVTFDRPHHNLRNVWLGNNSIAHLSLCIDSGSRYVRGSHLQRLRPRRGRGCVSWAPTLQLLSVERNQLEQLPQGLGGCTSLQVLQLSFNRISTLQPADLSHLQQLKELHLRHNLITSLHPQMFQDLAQLQFVDLSFNMLTSLHPLIHLSLHNIGADVMLEGNRWHCDCSMRSLRRRMAFDSSTGMQTWSMTCASPPILSGRNLLQLEEDDLNCVGSENRPESHQDVTVYSGSDILLSCATQDSLWLTPSGQASVSHPQAGLLTSDITEGNTGLFVCVSEEHGVVSVFNLQISKMGGARRKTRSLTRTSQQIIEHGTENRIGQERNLRATQSNLALAVCLSVFITFLIAFILGVLSRPCIDVLWRRVFKKKTSLATNSVSSVEQRQYDNEAYSNGEEQEQMQTHRERRVTFSSLDLREEGNVQYYDTVAGENQERKNDDAVIECEAAVAEKEAAEDAVSENSFQLRSSEDNQRGDRDLTVEGHMHNMEFEGIPDPVELKKRRSLSSGSDSSLSDKELNEVKIIQGNHSTPKSSQLSEDSVQQRDDFSAGKNVGGPQISIESETPGISSEPFADWSPHTNYTNPPELSQENEELFEFSDSARSTSARSSSVCVSFNDSKRIAVPTSDEQKRNDISSSSSNVSEDEPTHYTVNSDEEEKIERILNKPEVTNACLKQNAGFDEADPNRPSIKLNQGNNRFDATKPTLRSQGSFSSHSSDSDGKDYKVKKGCVPSLTVTSHGKSLDTGAPLTPEAYSSSSSGSEAETTNQQKQRVTHVTRPKIKESQTISHDSDLRWPALALEHNAQVKAQSLASDSSSRSDSEEDPIILKQEQKETYLASLPVKVSQNASHDPQQQWPALDLKHAASIKSRLDIKAPAPRSDTSSSSDTDDETTHHTKRPGKVDITGSGFQKSQTVSHDPDKRWPAFELQHKTRIQKHLDVKAPSTLPYSSSSSDSEDETTINLKKEEQGHIIMARPPSKVSQTASHDPQPQGPALDLKQTTSIKRRPDIKATSPSSDSSSSSDSEDETTVHRERPGKVNITGPKLQASQTQSHDPDKMFPAIDLKHAMRVKRRLDIKGPSQTQSFSSSSDSEDKTTIHLKKQQQEHIIMARPPSKVSQTASDDPQPQWPALDLKQTTSIKRRPDIKAPNPASDSSSSSDSDDETTIRIKKQGQGHINMARPPSKVSQTASHDPQPQWPALDLQQTTSIKRRLDIKATSPSSDSSSSSDSDDETTVHRERPGKVNITGPKFQVSQTQSHDPDKMFPAIDLKHAMRVKRRLDIKGPSQTQSFSSSSDSDDKTTIHLKKQQQEHIIMARPPSKVSQTASHDPPPQWPALDLKQTTSIKRHLDIKAPNPASDSSSSSDSDDETTIHIKKQGQGHINMARPQSKVSQTLSCDPQTQWPALDLKQTTSIKRRLDIKAPNVASDSSSSSDSEDETTVHTKKPEKVDITGPKFQVSQTQSHDPDKMFPAIDLKHAMGVKRRLDIKAPSPPQSLSSSSDSEDKTTIHLKKEEQGHINMARPPSKVSQTASYDPQPQWPALNLQQTTSIKRRLDIKASSPASDSSSSSDSEDETTIHIKKQEKEHIIMARPPSKVSQTASHDPQPQWPTLDLKKTTSIKRRLDIKAPNPAFDSSSSSDSDDETTVHRERPEKVNITGPKFQVSQTQSHDPDKMFPAIDLKHAMRVKRRLDIKGPSQTQSFSSSSDSEDKTTIHLKKQQQEHIILARPPSKVSQTASHDPPPQWPALDLKQTTSIKRRLDIKAPNPASDSSSSSDSDDATTIHIKKQGQGHINMARPQSKVSQTLSCDPQTQWPALDLKQTTSIKRRLDIKVSSPASDSSSSSDSEDKTTVHRERPEKVDITGPKFQLSQTQSHDPDKMFPAIDLKHAMRVKRRLDIKAPSPPQSLSSSSDSEDKTTIHLKKEEQGHINMARPPSKVSQTASYDPQPQWPALNLQQTTSIKRRLDIKVSSPASDSSSSSDSEDETTVHRERPEKVDITGPKFQLSQTQSHDPDKMFPAIDLKHAMRVKRRLDIKAPSPPQSLSSSSDSEDKTTIHLKKQQQKHIIMARPPSKVSQTASHDPQPQWPVLDLKQTTSIKRRLDIKAPNPASDSSSSSDSDDATTIHIKKQGQGHINIARPQSKVSQTVSRDPQTQWPALDLKQTTSIKRRLDIKAPNPASDSSSKSDSDDETTVHTKKPEKVDITGPKFQVSQTQSQDPDKMFPAIDLKHALRVKRRLDIKGPSPTQSLSSSSDCEDKTTIHLKKQEKEHIIMARPPSKVSQTASHDPQPQWPVLDLKQTTSIKRRLDIKAPKPASDSSSSSDSDNETTIHIKKQGQEHINMARPPSKVSQTASHDPQPQWPALDLKQTTSIKRRLDIKAPNVASDSSSSSDSEDETTVHTKKPEKVDITGPKFQLSQTQSHDPDKMFPAIDLKHAMRVKRRLDIKAPSPPQSLSSSSDSDNKTTIHIKKQGQEHINMARPPSKVSQTASHDPQPQWPALDLKQTTSIKRRLDIKAPNPASDSSSKSDSDDETTVHTNKSEKVDIKGPTFQGYKTQSHDPDKTWPALDLDHTMRIKRRLDIKAPSPPPDSLSSHKIGLGVSAISKMTENKLNISAKSPVINISRSPKTDYNIQLEKYTVITDDKRDKTKSVNMSTTPDITPELQSSWAAMNLGRSRFRKRLEISSNTHEPPNLSSSPPPDSPSSSSESGTGSKSSRTRQQRRAAGVSQDQTSLYVANAVNLKPVQPQSQTEEVQRTARVELSTQTSNVEESDSVRPHLSFPRVKRSLDIRVPFQTKSSSSSNSEDEMIDHSVPDLSLGVPRIKRRMNVKAPLPESSSSSENENKTIGSTANQSRHLSNISARTEDDSLITYKRVIMKASSPPSNSVSFSDKEQTATNGVEMKRIEQNKLITPVDLPPVLRWTGVGRQLPDLTIPSPMRHLYYGSSSPQQVPPAGSELPPPDSSGSESDDEVKQGKGKADVTWMNKHSSLSAKSVSLSSSRALDKIDNPPSSRNEIMKAAPEDKNERKGLSALKVMSSERRHWDTLDVNVDRKASLQPLTQSQITSTSVESRVIDLLYGIPHYRRHDIGGVKRSQGAPPPIPATPPPT